METRAEKQKKREESITAKKKDVKVIALSKILYDGKEFISSEKFLMSSDDYKMGKSMGCVISESDKNNQEESEIQEKKDSKKSSSSKK